MIKTKSQLRLAKGRRERRALARVERLLTTKDFNEMATLPLKSRLTRAINAENRLRLIKQHMRALVEQGKM